MFRYFVRVMYTSPPAVGTATICGEGDNDVIDRVDKMLAFMAPDILARVEIEDYMAYQSPRFLLLRRQYHTITSGAP